MKKFVVANSTQKIDIHQAKAKANEIAQEIEEVFISNDIMAEYHNTDVVRFDRYTAAQANISFYIVGDWKHDHMRADQLVRRLYGDSIGVECDDVSDSDDWYSAIHLYQIRLDGML